MSWVHCVMDLEAGNYGYWGLWRGGGNVFPCCLSGV